MFKRMSLILVIALSILITGCTQAGIECGLIGKWEYLATSYKIVAEFTADDEFIYKYSSNETEVIKKAKINSVNYGYIELDKSVYDSINNSESATVYYQDLGCDCVRLRIGYNGTLLNFRKVY